MIAARRAHATKYQTARIDRRGEKKGKSERIDETAASNTTRRNFQTKGRNKNNRELRPANFLFVIFTVCKQKSWQPSRKPVTAISLVQFSPSWSKDRACFCAGQGKTLARFCRVIADRPRNSLSYPRTVSKIVETSSLSPNS